jgi:hypothetical protein
MIFSMETYRRLLFGRPTILARNLLLVCSASLPYL